MTGTPPGSDLTVDIDVDRHVATVEIHRPPNNFFDYDLIHEIANVYERLDADPRCRAIVLCSEGRHFCAGADFSAREKWSRERLDGQAGRLYVEAVRVFSCTKPVVAAVQGAAVGGGLGLALSADFRIACEESRFVANFARLGIHQGFGLSVTLPRLVGHNRAALMLYDREASQGTGGAVEIGLADELVGLADVRSRALELATEIAQSAPLAVQSIRATTLRRGLAEAVREATDHELAEQSRLRRTDDHREGVAATAERRLADFTGTMKFSHYPFSSSASMRLSIPGMGGQPPRVAPAHLAAIIQQRLKRVRQVARRTSGALEQAAGEGVGVAFEFPGVAGRGRGNGDGGKLLQERVVGAQDRGRNHEHPADAQHLAHPVALAHVTQLVGDHREDSVVVVEHAHEVVGDHDRTAGECEGVGAEQSGIAKSELRDRIDAGPPCERLRRGLDARPSRFGEAGGREHGRVELPERLPADEGLRPVWNQHHRPIRDHRHRGTQTQDREDEHPEQNRGLDRREPLQPVRPPGHLRFGFPEEPRGELLEGHEALPAAEREGLRDAGEPLARPADLDFGSGGIAGAKQVEPSPFASQGRIDALGGPGLVEVSPYPQIGIPMSWISPNSSPNA